MDIVGQTIIVVGGSSGMGLEVARAALAKGAEVVIVGRSQQRLAQAVEELSGKHVRTIAADVTSEEEVSRIFESVGRFDHLFVSAASNLTYQPIRELDMEAARKTIDAKLVAALLLAKYAARTINAHGSITFISGIAAERPMPAGYLVGAVNGALFSLVYGLTVALAPVRVNAVSPGWIDTPIWDANSALAANKSATFAQMAQRLPAGRIGQPADIAHAALFLMENEFTTGTVLPVDGGHRLI
ncbi:short chain dehydrogenase [Reticulibacter mediterranei]|uniref:Short chain dehydrogenase n=1 Tax=Reticulibacter mediterranei TaxID=2778369 RepID=A0A8J3IYS1_9CHLR|nr:SDR family oxidoreductase [Reticulibacter mediterranei]GHO99255.1 short chain dehydrogenase [Reticulibacter mediterranei]